MSLHEAEHSVQPDTNAGLSRRSVVLAPSSDPFASVHARGPSPISGRENTRSRRDFLPWYSPCQGWHIPTRPMGPLKSTPVQGCISKAKLSYLPGSWLELALLAQPCLGTGFDLSSHGTCAKRSKQPSSGEIGGKQNTAVCALGQEPSAVAGHSSCCNSPSQT